tara:strand:+ start:647 stop:1090 length:444 start_codon:yes stop_codon:yes gene_type:complete
MQKQQEQIKIVKLINGDDIVTVMPVGDKQLPDKSVLIRLFKPLQIKYVPQITPTGFRDYIALIRWTNYTNDNVVTIPKDKILTITNASPEMAVSYNTIANNYHKMESPTSDRSKYEKKELTPEQNKKINEIFDEFMHNEDEDPPTIH